MLEPQLCRQRAKGCQTQDAYHQKDHRLHPERPGEHAAQQCGGRADGNQMEVILKVLASSARKPTAAASQRMGEICMVCYLLMLLLYGIPLGEGQELFTGTLHRKQNIDKNGKKVRKSLRPSL